MFACFAANTVLDFVKSKCLHQFFFSFIYESARLDCIYRVVIVNVALFGPKYSLLWQADIVETSKIHYMCHGEKENWHKK